jgi:hypothetical protein
VRPAPQAVAPRAAEFSDRERILWLLEFLRRDVASLRPGELISLRNDVFPYLHCGDLRRSLFPTPGSCAHWAGPAMTSGRKRSR